MDVEANQAGAPALADWNARRPGIELYTRAWFVLLCLIDARCLSGLWVAAQKRTRSKNESPFPRQSYISFFLLPGRSIPQHWANTKRLEILAHLLLDDTKLSRSILLRHCGRKEWYFFFGIDDRTVTYTMSPEGFVLT